MIRRVRWIVLLMGMGATVLMPAQINADPDERKVVERTIEVAVVPSVTAFREHAGQLLASLTDRCANDSTSEAFIQSVAAFSRIEYLRLGPLNQENRAERVFFWPDRKGTGQRQLRRLLIDPQLASIDAPTLAKKSVAVQGLPALERILFGSQPPSDDVCQFGRTIAENLLNIANELESDWTSDDGIAMQLTQPKPESAYRTHKESLAALLTQATNALENISERKLALIIKGLTDDGTVPRQAPFQRSAQTLANIRNNLVTVQPLLLDSGLASRAGRQWTDQLAFEFRTAFTMIDAAEAALLQNDNQTAIKRLTAAQSILSNGKVVVEEPIAGHFGVSTDFNSSDGD